VKKITTNETTINNTKLQKFIIPLLLLSLVLIFSFTMGTVSAAVRSPSPVSDTIYVNNATGNDSWDGQSATWISGTKTGPKLSIKNATGTVNQGGTVKIAKGIYKGENNTGITIDRNMTIIGQSRTGTVIDAQGKDKFHIIISGINVTILNLTFKNGTSSVGGAISNKGNLTVNNCNFTGNKATQIGGAIINYGTLIAKNCTFNDNIARSNSGAIANSGTCIIIGCTFTNNTVNNGNGGAIFNYDGILTVNDSTFAGNHADFGGAIYNDGGNCNITSSKFKDNGNCEEGGAIYNNNALNIKDSIFTSNRAGWGGAIANYGTSTITGSTFGGDNSKANIATYEGGVDAPGSSLTASKTGYYLLKFLSPNAQLYPEAKNGNSSFVALMSKTELYLIFAEAMNELAGPDDKRYGLSAREALSKIRKRAGFVTDPYMASITTKSDFKALVHNERRVELCFEGKRFWDLRRWEEPINTNVSRIRIKSENGSFIYESPEVVEKKLFNSPFMPLPLNETIIIPDLKQNDGWSN
jgi:hypothetical protein